MKVIYRGDLDGTVCTALLLDAGLADESMQAHPQDMQDGKVDVTSSDILCNLPYHPDCHMWFDHHSSELAAENAPKEFKGVAAVAPSAAGLVYTYLLPDHPELKKYEKIVQDTDRLDSADLSISEVTDPQGTILLGYLLDPRTGLGHRHDFAISNFAWGSQMPRLLTRHSVDEILAMPDTSERIAEYNEMQQAAADFYTRHSRLDGNVIVTDVRGQQIPAANRFLIYTLPGLETGNISIRVADGKRGEFNTISVAHSIFVRTSQVDAGELCKQYGGGGHRGAANCQPSIADTKRVLAELIAACKE